MGIDQLLERIANGIERAATALEKIADDIDTSKKSAEKKVSGK